MGQAAAQDEDAEEHGDPLVLGDQVAALADEPEDRQGDAEIGDGDHQVGDRVQGQDVRPPQQAIAVRQEPRRAEKGA